MSELIARGKQPGTAVIYIRKVGSSIRDINFPVHVSMKAKNVRVTHARCPADLAQLGCSQSTSQNKHKEGNECLELYLTVSCVSVQHTSRGTILSKTVVVVDRSMLLPCERTDVSRPMLRPSRAYLHKPSRLNGEKGLHV